MKYLFLPLKIIVVAYLFYYLYTIIDINKVYKLLLNLDIKTLIIIIVLTVFLDIIKIFKWSNLSRLENSDIDMYDIAQSYFKGVVLAIITPGALGELARGSFIKGSSKKSNLVGKTFYDKFLDLITLSLISSVGYLVYLDYAYFLPILFLVYLIVILNTQNIIYYSFSLLFFLKKMDMFNNFITGAKTVTKSVSIKNSIASIIFFIILYYQQILLFKSQGIDFPIEGIMYLPVITLSAYIPLSISGIGIRESVAILLLSKYSISNEIIFSTIFIHFAIVSIIPIFYGFVVIFIAQRRENVVPK